MEITKASGEKEVFKHEKLVRSLKKAGVPKDLIDEVCDELEPEIKPGMSTSEISEKALRCLLKKEPVYAARYNLKRGIMDLGPAGFLFEQYVEAILRSYGYKTERNKIMKGRCVSHEIDVIAHENDNHYLIEAKYRNDPGVKTDLAVAMYADARLLDITPEQERKERGGVKHRMWLFTNAKFTSKAIKYGKCKNIKMTGWRYPQKESLENLITQKALYPVTTLPSVNRYAREQFAMHNILLVQDLLSYSANDLIQKFNIFKEKAQPIVLEARLLMNRA